MTWDGFRFSRTFNARVEMGRLILAPNVFGSKNDRGEGGEGGERRRDLIKYYVSLRGGDEF